jgi:hypothetical protein
VLLLLDVLDDLEHPLQLRLDQLLMLLQQSLRLAHTQLLLLLKLSFRLSLTHQSCSHIVQFIIVYHIAVGFVTEKKHP